MTTANILEPVFVWCSLICTEKSQAKFYTEVNGFTNNDGLTINDGGGRKTKNSGFQSFTDSSKNAT